MDWIPIVLVTFKFLVFGTGMFFAIKWHYDKEQAEKKKRKTDNNTGVSSAPVPTLGSSD